MSRKLNLAAMAASAPRSAEQQRTPAQPTPPAPTPILVRLSDVEPTEVSWLWPGRISLGRLSLIVGRPGVGKSFLTTALVAHVTTGRPFPDGSSCPSGSALIISAEDDPADTIRPRLDANGADAARVQLLKGSRHTLPDGRQEDWNFTLSDVPTLAAALEANPDCKLVVIDPIGSYMGGRTDTHRDNEVRAVLTPIAELAAKHGVAVVMVMHRRKSDGDFADDTALGSRAFTGIARAVWHLECDPEDKDRCLFLPGKNNLTAAGDGLAFRIEGKPVRIVWENGPVSMSADDLQAAVAKSAATKRQLGRPPESLQAAEDFLRTLLSTGPKPLAEVKEEATKASHAWRTVERASHELGVIKSKSGFGGGAFWRLPGTGEPSPPESPRGNNSGVLAGMEKQAENRGFGPAPAIPAKMPDSGGDRQPSMFDEPDNISQEQWEALKR